MMHILFVCLMVLLGVVGIVVVGGLALFLLLIGSSDNPFR
jgi:hypothetical protein